MKIKVEFDITPKELRESLGLPDVQPLHDEVMEKIREKVIEGVGNYDPMNFLSAYSAEGARTLQGLQQALWGGFAGRGKEEDESKP